MDDIEFDIKLYQVETIGVAEEDGGIVSATVTGGTTTTLPSPVSAINPPTTITEDATEDTTYDFIGIDDTSVKEVVIDVELAAIMALSTLQQTIRYIRPKQHYHYLYLDTNNGIFSPDRSQIKWLINDGDPIYQPNYINLTRPLRNIIMMRLGRTAWSSMDKTNTNILSNNRIGLGFSEFASQCIILPTGPRLHFVQIISAACTALGPGIHYDYESVSSGNTISTSSFFENRGWFRFRKHFTKLDTLTLNLWNLSDMSQIIIPDSYVSLPAIQTFKSPSPVPIWAYEDPWPDNYIIIYYWDLFIMPIIYAIRQGRPDYNLPVTVLGEQFIYSGFTTDDPLADAELIAAYNTTHTLLFGVPHILTIPIDFPPIFPPINIDSAHLNIDTYAPITITFLYKPRMITTLELITEDI
jgi:hypothetical protein